MRNRHSDLWIPCTDALPLSHKVQLCSSYVPEIVLKRLCIYRKSFVLVTEGLVSIKGFSQPSVAHLSKKKKFYQANNLGALIELGDCALKENHVLFMVCLLF